MASKPIETKPKTEIAYEALIQRLGGKEPTCLICHGQDWVVETHLAAVPATQQFEHPPWKERDPLVFPYMAMVCKSCGHTVFFNLVQLGLTDLFDMHPLEKVTA